jgi:hypothetical protein
MRKFRPRPSSSRLSRRWESARTGTALMKLPTVGNLSWATLLVRVWISRSGRGVSCQGVIHRRGFKTTWMCFPRCRNCFAGRAESMESVSIHCLPAQGIHPGGVASISQFIITPLANRRTPPNPVEQSGFIGRKPWIDSLSNREAVEKFHASSYTLKRFEYGTVPYSSNRKLSDK